MIYITEEIVGWMNNPIDSAAGGAKEAKAPFQAIMPLRGKIKNTTSLELADIIKSDVIKDILTCLGCGIGTIVSLSWPTPMQTVAT